MVTKPHKSAERKKAAPPAGRVLSEAEVLDALRKAAVLSGSDPQPARAFETPGLGLSLGITLADRFSGVAVDAVLPAGPSSMVLGFTTALGVGARLLAERGDAKRVLVVTDLVDGAPTLMQLLALVPADVLAGVGCLIERSGAGRVAERLGVPFVALARVD